MNLFSQLKTTAKAPPEFTPEELALLTKLADKIVKRRMTVPAVMFFESVKPMNFVGAQAMIFLQPFVTAFFTLPEYDRLREMLERRETLYRFVDLLEQREDEFLLQEKQAKAEAKAKQIAEGKQPWWKRILGK
ncbi:MAG: hypothetical protein OEM52_08870 [bacterium]|nr:hypothetical protein [bacterium]